MYDKQHLSGSEKYEETWFNHTHTHTSHTHLYTLRSKDTGSHQACPHKSSCRNRGRCRRQSPPHSKCRPSCQGSRNRRRWSWGDPGRWPWGYMAQSSMRGGQFHTESPCSWWGTGRKTWTQRSGTVLHFDTAPTGRQSQQSRICHLHVQAVIFYDIHIQG